MISASRFRRVAFPVVALIIVLMCRACSSPEGYIAGIAAATALGGQAPTNELHQVYYLGTFDPLEQVPSAVFRVTIHGQGSFISQTKFASGWVPAVLCDTLNSSIGISEEGELDVGAAATGTQGLELGRRMFMFGPHGFLKAPENHRLVIVMGSNPSAFFNAVGEGLQQVVDVKLEADNSQAAAQIMREYIRIQGHYDRMRDLQASLAGSGT